MTPLATQQIFGVPVSGGVFTVKLNFPAMNFDGSDRWLEIAVKRLSQTNFTTLDTRQKITSAPYAIKSQSADIATNADNAANSTLFGGLTTGDFVQNTTTQQSADFNISGDGTLGGTLLANRVGIGGLPQTNTNFEVTGNSVFRTANGNVNIGTPNFQTGLTIVSTNRADIRFNGSTLKLLAGTGTGAMADTNGIAVNTLGNVGIGTTTPANKLDVAGNASTSGSLNVGTSAGIGGVLSVGNGINVTNGISINSGNLFVAGATTLNNGLTLTGDAGVSGKITTNSLRVNSGGFSFVTVAGSYTQDICRDITAGTLGQCGTSLLRYKSNVETFNGGLNVVKNLRPVIFNWKASGQQDIGFIAEEVFQIEPRLTTSGENGELEGVKYKQINVVLVNALQEQQKQIEQQQRQINALTRLVCSQNTQAEICKEQEK